MSWFDAVAYGPPDRANGMRFPPRTAARRSEVTAGTTVITYPLHNARLALTYSGVGSLANRLGEAPLMSDRYASFAHSGPGRFLVRRLGLPDPPRLRRHRAGDPVVDGPVLVGGSGRLVEPVRKTLA